MGRQIIIGTEGNQPFPIGDRQVSRRHAILNVDDHGRTFIIDNNSTNGTYIYNGSSFVRLSPQQPYPVNGDSMVQFGPNTRFHLRRVLAPVVNGGINNPGRNVGEKKRPTPPPPPKKRVNIKGLRLVSDAYTEKKFKLDAKSGTINNLRSCTILIMTVAGLVGTLLSNNSDNGMMGAIISVVAAIVLMVILLLIINNANKKLILERAENEKKYAVKYVCPECGVSFRGKIYENILSEGRCPRCKAEYYDSDQKN